MARPKSPETPTWHHVATRLTSDERAKLIEYRDRHGLKSLNAAVRHMIKNSA